MKSLGRVRYLVCAIGFLSVAIVSFSAMADMTITPTRVVFEDRDRFQQVTIINTSNKTKSYGIDWAFFKMVEGGAAAYEPAEESLTEFDLSKYIVYSPRRITLSPGGKQKVRLALRRPAGGVPDGEYRAHLRFMGRDPDPKVSPIPSEGSGIPGEVNFGLKVNVGYSIPVVFRSGLPDEVAEIQSVAFERNEASGRLHAIIDVRREEGSYGVLGHLYVRNANGGVIGEVSNAHIFPEVSGRVFDVPLLEDGLAGTSIEVSLVYYDSSVSARVYDKKTYPVL